MVAQELVLAECVLRFWNGSRRLRVLRALVLRFWWGAWQRQVLQVLALRLWHGSRRFVVVRATCALRELALRLEWVCCAGGCLVGIGLGAMRLFFIIVRRMCAMKAVFIIAVIALAACSFAAFGERALVQVLDLESRPIEGAAVHAVYQFDYQTGFVNSKTVFTNKDGYVNVSFSNTEFDPALQEGNYTVVASFGGKEASRSVEADPKRKWVVQLQLAVHYVTFIVVDQSGKPLRANVTVGNSTFATNREGVAQFHLSEGTHEYAVQWADTTQTGSINVNGAVVQQVALQKYALRIFVGDENDAPLEAGVMVNGREYFTDESGRLVVEDVGQNIVQADIDAGGKRKTGQIDLSSGLETKVTMDISPPVIRDVQSSIVQGIGQLSFGVRDEGARAAGIGDGSGVRVLYRVSEAQGEASLFPVGYGRYKAEIPAQLPGTFVMYTIIAADTEGNEARIEGSYTVIEWREVAVPQEPQQSEQTVDANIIMAVAGAVALVVCAGAYLYIRRRKEGAEPPQQV